MNLVEIRAIVHDYIDDTTVTVDQHIIDSVNYLSNFFHLKKIDDTDTSVADQDYLDVPTNSKEIRRLMIDDEEIKKLEEFNDQKDAEDKSAQRWYEDNEKIMLTQDMDSTGDEIKKWYNKKFKVPEAAVNTDVPDEILELVYVGAAWRYWRKIVSTVASNREDYPDTDPDEARRILRNWKDEFKYLMEEYKKER